MSGILLFWRWIWEACGGILSGTVVRVPYPAQYPSDGQSASDSASLDQYTTTTTQLEERELISVQFLGILVFYIP